MQTHAVMLSKLITQVYNVPMILWTRMICYIADLREARKICGTRSGHGRPVDHYHNPLSKMSLHTVFFGRLMKANIKVVLNNFYFNWSILSCFPCTALATARIHWTLPNKKSAYTNKRMNNHICDVSDCPCMLDKLATFNVANLVHGIICLPRPKYKNLFDSFEESLWKCLQVHYGWNVRRLNWGTEIVCRLSCLLPWL